MGKYLAATSFPGACPEQHLLERTVGVDRTRTSAAGASIEARSAATQMTPGAIVRRRAGSGPIPEEEADHDHEEEEHVMTSNASRRRQRSR